MTKEKKFSTVPAAEKAAAEAAWLEEHKAKDITALTVGNELTDIVILATATSQRHARSLADGLISFCKDNHYEHLGKEGYDAASWILVDLNDVIVHIFLEDTRQLYDLEGLWRDAEPFLLKNRA